MPKFRKRPVVVEAVQWFPGILHSGVQVELEHDSPSRVPGEVAFRIPAMAYVTPIHRQKTWLTPGDWILPEPDGIHFYPCKPDIFEATYEPVEAAGMEGKENSDERRS